MSNFSKSDAAPASDEESGGVARLANQALSVLASRKGGTLPALHDHYIGQLTDAAKATDPSDVMTIRDRMLADGIEPIDISDVYIPAAARLLGEAWCSDEASFATVTIGASRLQGLLRTLGTEWSSSDLSRSDAPASLILLAKEAYHTLGAVILAGQLRRRGLAVRLIIGLELEELERLLEAARYDVVMISASTSERLEPLSTLVHKIKKRANPPPVVIGGTVLEQKVDVKTLTGADCATSDLDEALKYCGLTDYLAKPAHQAGQR
ncbi:B12-binding domain-containing protein [Aestuariibius insulae]|uniref:cobalamin B12-binding domain-containing protein n=1 Tax=Aestuariibius insulae TaxID=2058287 RepID=UPI00345EF0D5